MKAIDITKWKTELSLSECDLHQSRRVGMACWPTVWSHLDLWEPVIRGWNSGTKWMIVHYKVLSTEVRTQWHCAVFVSVRFWRILLVKRSKRSSCGVLGRCRWWGCKPICTDWGRCVAKIWGPPKSPRHLMCDMKQFSWNLTPMNFVPMKYICSRLHLKCDGTRAGTRFHLSTKQTSPFNRRGHQFSRLLAGELCTSAYRVCTARASLCSAVMWRLLVTHCILLFPLHFSSRASPCAITFQLDSISRLVYLLCGAASFSGQHKVQHLKNE